MRTFIEGLRFFCPWFLSAFRGPRATDFFSRVRVKMGRKNPFRAGFPGILRKHHIWGVGIPGALGHVAIDMCSVGDGGAGTGGAHLCLLCRGRVIDLVPTADSFSRLFYPEWWSEVGVGGPR